MWLEITEQPHFSHRNLKTWNYILGHDCLEIKNMNKKIWQKTLKFDSLSKTSDIKSQNLQNSISKSLTAVSCMTNVLSNNCSTYDQDKIKDIFKNKIKRCAISALLLGKANHSFCFPGCKLRGRPRKQWNSLNLVLANFSSFKVNHYYLMLFNWYQFFRFRTYIYITKFHF